MIIFLKLFLLALLPAFITSTDTNVLVSKNDFEIIKKFLTKEPKPETVDLLISQGFNLEVRDPYRNTVLHVAAGLDHSLFLKVYSLYPNLLKAQNVIMETPVFRAAESGQLETVEFIAMKDRSLAIALSSQTMSPIELAIISNQIHVCNFLVKLHSGSAFFLVKSYLIAQDIGNKTIEYSLYPLVKQFFAIKELSLLKIGDLRYILGTREFQSAMKSFHESSLSKTNSFIERDSFIKNLMMKFSVVSMLDKVSFTQSLSFLSMLNSDPENAISMLIDRAKVRLSFNPAKNIVLPNEILQQLSIHFEGEAEYFDEKWMGYREGYYDFFERILKGKQNYLKLENLDSCIAQEMAASLVFSRSFKALNMVTKAIIARSEPFNVFEVFQVFIVALEKKLGRIFIILKWLPFAEMYCKKDFLSLLPGGFLNSILKTSEIYKAVDQMVSFFLSLQNGKETYTAIIDMLEAVKFDLELVELCLPHLSPEMVEFFHNDHFILSSITHKAHMKVFQLIRDNLSFDSKEFLKNKKLISKSSPNFMKNRLKSFKLFSLGISISSIEESYDSIGVDSLFRSLLPTANESEQNSIKESKISSKKKEYKKMLKKKNQLKKKQEKQLEMQRLQNGKTLENSKNISSIDDKLLIREIDSSQQTIEILDDSEEKTKVPSQEENATHAENREESLDIELVEDEKVIEDVLLEAQHFEAIVKKKETAPVINNPKTKRQVARQNKQTQITSQGDDLEYRERLRRLNLENGIETEKFEFAKKYKFHPNAQYNLNISLKMDNFSTLVDIFYHKNSPINESRFLSLFDAMGFDIVESAGSAKTFILKGTGSQSSTGGKKKKRKTRTFNAKEGEILKRLGRRTFHMPHGVHTDFSELSMNFAARFLEKFGIRPEYFSEVTK